MFGLLTCSSSQSIGQLSYTCFAMSEAESLGENRNSFVFPLTKMRRRFIISAGTLLDILPMETDPDAHAKKKRKTKQNKQTKRSRRSAQATEINVNELGSLALCFPDARGLRSPRLGAGGAMPAGRGGGHSGRAAAAAGSPSSSSSPSAAAAAAAAPGGPRRVTRGHGAVRGG